MKRKRLTALVIAFVMLAALIPAGAHAAGETLTPLVTSNSGWNNYVNWGRWSDNMWSYIYDSGDGTFTRVEYNSDTHVTVEKYSDSGIFEQFEITMELPLWGGFYAGEKWNFVVFGQANLEEKDSAEVMRVVRYTKDWQRVDSASVYGSNTAKPFEAGSLRMTEKDGMLYIHTCHLMYGGGGTRHQANMWLNVTEPESGGMTVSAIGCAVSNTSHDYVSHSFNQFVLADGNYLVKLDHGDAHPRSVTLCRGKASGYNGRGVERVDVLPISGASGANDTGVSVGGFEYSDTNYIVAGSSVEMGNSYDAFGLRNIFISTVNKSDLSVKTTYITRYSGDSPVVSNPMLVKLSPNRMLLMWTEDDATLRYVLLKGDGSTVSSIVTAEGALSDCQPVLMDGIVKWYVTDGTSVKLYSIDASTLRLSVKVLGEGQASQPDPNEPDIFEANEDSEVSFSVSASGTDPKYQWQYSDDDGASWKDCDAYEVDDSGAVRSTGSKTGHYTFIARRSMNNNLYRCKVTLDGGFIAYSSLTRLVLLLKPTPAPTPGDLNGDGEVDNVDLVMLARYNVALQTLDETQLKAADLNGDTRVDNLDLVSLARFIVNL